MLINGEKGLLQNFRQTCRHHKLRVTPQRVLIYKELIKSDDHPSADVLYKQISKNYPDVSFDTVYRTLATFAEMGLIARVDGFGTSMRFEPKRGDHHHFRCRQCSRIIDFKSDRYNKLAIPKDIADECEVFKLQVTLEGFCRKCKKKSNNRERSWCYGDK
jgi:Fur family peroxide stress response transcriptional regulator